MEDSSADEMERLLSRMGSIEPPPNFLDRVLAQATAIEPSAPGRRSTLEPVVYAVAYLVALLGLAVLAFDLGLSVARNGISALVSVLLADMTLFRDAPGPYLGAIGASLPWLHMAAVALDLLLLAILTRLAFDGRVRDAGRPPTAAGA
jgi:hypothetical protein